MSIAYYNGEFMPVDQVKIPLTDRAVFFGDGIYEALLAKDGALHFEDLHIKRFFDNKKLLGINFDMNEDELSALLREGVKLSGEKCAFVYFQLTKYARKRIHACPKSENYNFLMTVTEQPLPSPKKRMRLVTYPDLRYGYCNIKTLNLLPSVIASEFAERQGADEAVFCRGNIVTECAHSNLFAVKDGIVYTHPKCEKILPGITREALLCECRKLKIPRREEPFTKDFMYSADALLVTSSTKICSLAESIDNYPFSKGSETAELICENLHNNFTKYCR